MINNIKKIVKGVLYQNEKTQDLFSSCWLERYYPEKYFPYSESTLRTHSLMNFANDVIINNRKEILEFGSGFSTIILAKIAKKNDLDIKIFSVDDNPEWISILKKYLDDDQLDKYVTFIYAPLSECDKSLNNNRWYDKSVLTKCLGANLFNTVLVDGPMAYTQNNELARFPALEFVQGKLSNKYSFFLDDTNRKGEQKVVKAWENIFGLKFIKINDSFSYYSSHENYNFILK